MDSKRCVTVDELDSGVAIVTMDRKEVRNVLNKEMVQQLMKSIRSLEDNKDILAVVLKGSGGNFAAGADINEIVGASSAKAYAFAKEMETLQNLIIHSEKPYIAAIEGYCLGGGLELALACDIRLVNHTSKLGLPEINLGIIPGGGGIQRLFEIVGTSITTQLTMTGETIDGKEASNMHIASFVESDVYDEAIRIAELIAEKSMFAITSLKRLISKRNYRQSISNINEDIFEFSLLFDHPDSLEGLSAFLQKRQPNFKRSVEEFE